MIPSSTSKPSVTLISAGCLFLTVLTGCDGGPRTGRSTESVPSSGTLLLWHYSDQEPNTYQDDAGPAVLVNPADGSLQELNSLGITRAGYSTVDVSADRRVILGPSADGGLSLTRIDGTKASVTPIPESDICDTDAGTSSNYRPFALSPSGKRVVCITDERLRVLDVDGKSSLNEIDLSDRSSGRYFAEARFLGEDQLAYIVEGYNAESSGLYLESIAGGDAEQVAQGHIGAFDTASNGSAIAFSVGKSYTAQKIAKYSVYLHTTDTLFAPTDGGENTHVWNLEFSPDDSSIAYTFGTLPEDTDGIYVMNADGSNPRRIVRTDSTEYIVGFVFSPDGTRLAIDIPSETASLAGLSTGGIHLFHADGTDRTGPKPLLDEESYGIVAWVR